MLNRLRQWLRTRSVKRLNRAMMAHHREALLTLVLLVLATAQLRASNPTIGIIGDSNSDEYRADDNRAGGTAYEATTLNWFELLTKYRAIDAGQWGSYGSPRRSGYAFNWALSATRACDIQAQADGLAAQHVDYAIIFTGANDFHSWNGTYAEVYSGELSGSALQAKIDSVISCITVAVDVLLSSGTNHIVLSNFADPGNAPSLMANFPNADYRNRVSSAINSVNTQLATLAISRGIVLTNLAAFSTSLLSRVSGQYLVVGSEAINMGVQGDEPHHFQLQATVGHLGTVGNGLLANFFMDALQAGYGLNLPRFTDSEILANAGIGAAVATNTPQPTATRTLTPTRTNTPVATATFTRTPTVAVKAIRIVSRINGYVAFDGIVEDGAFTEVTSNRFTHAGWSYMSNGGRNGSPVYYVVTGGKTITFNTTASTLAIQTFKSPLAVWMDVYVNNVLRVSYRDTGANAAVDVNVAL